MSITALLLRRSLGRTVFPAFAVLILLNSLLRSMAWRYEWMWAIYQYNFTVVLLSPLLAGVAAWEGYRLSRSSAFLTSHHRPFALLAAAWGALLAWCVTAFVIGLALVLGIVALSGSPLTIGIPEIVTPVPAVALLAAVCAVGLTAGWLSGSKLTAPLAAVTVFLASLLLYASDFSEFITVGGATGSLVGLQPNVPIQMSQTAFFALAAALAIIVGAFLASWYRSPRWPVVAVAAILTVASAYHLSTSGPLYLEARHGDVTCSGSHPSICLGRSYTQFEPELRTSLRPFVTAVENLGIRAPSSFRQDAVLSSHTTGQISLDTMHGDKDLLVDMFLGTYYSPRCQMEPGSKMEKDYMNARYWLARAAGAHAIDDPTVDPLLIKGSSRQQDAIARAAFRGLMTCHG
jgi:hypothetical protein